MDFTGLKQSYESLLAGTQTRVENKQRLNLSEHAMMTLMKDLDIFDPASSEQSGTERISSVVLNRIIAHFRGEAQSSIAQAVYNEKIRLSDILQNIQPESIQEKIIETMVSDHRSQLIRKMKTRCQERGSEVYFRVNKENLDYLLSDEGQAEAELYNDKVGLYFKALIEEYCECSYVDREKIFFKDFMDEIQLAIDYKKLLKVTLRSKSQLGNTRKNNIQYVKPLCVMQDPEHLYNYLVGMISSSREGPWHVGSIRFTSILHCDHQMFPISISSKVQEGINEEIRKKGVQFLADNQTAQQIVVKFTPKGKSMYQKMLHLRPQYVRKDAENIYVFNCSIRQAHNYFFKFGKDATILEPDYLAKTFLTEYMSAVESYSENT